MFLTSLPSFYPRPVKWSVKIVEQGMLPESTFYVKSSGSTIWLTDAARQEMYFFSLVEAEKPTSITLTDR